MSETPFGRRLRTVTGIAESGAYRVLRAADPDGPKPQPGQFAMLSTAERWAGSTEERPLLPRAFSVARWHGDGAAGTGGGESHFLLEDVGPGTKRLCELNAGDGLWVLGPLGQGFIAPAEDRRAILVGGGVGIAPLAILQDELLARATHAQTPQTSPTVLLGFRDAPRAQGASLLREIGRAHV